ncbi:MAG TPA: hypothetical protein VH592_20800 [Gemmataceae bacterium]
MRGNWFVAGFLAAVGVLAWGGSSRAGDTIRLNMVDNTPTQGLVDNGQGADTIRTWHRGFGWGGWGGRGLGWGGWGGRGLGWGGLGWGGRGLGWGGWGWGGRGLGWGGWGWGGRGLGLGWGGLGWGGLGWGGWGLSRPFYGFGLGSPLGWGVGWGGLGYGGFWPCAGVSASVYTLNAPPITFDSPLPGAVQPGAPNMPPAQPRNDGTFPYDGGPNSPVPNPKEAAPSSTPRSVPLEGRAVSLPKAAPKWTYPAYGERARRTTPESERTYFARGEQK